MNAFVGSFLKKTCKYVDIRCTRRVQTSKRSYRIATNLLNLKGPNVTTQVKYSPPSDQAEIIKIGDKLWDQFQKSDCKIDKEVYAIRTAGAYTKAMSLGAIDTRNFELYIRISMCYIAARKYYVAIKSIEKALQINQMSFDAYKLLSEACYLSKSWHKGIEIFTKLLTEFGGHFTKKGPKRDNIALIIDEENPLAEVMYKRGVCYEMTNDTEAARDSFEAVSKLPKSKYTSLALYKLGYFRCLHGKWQSSVEYLDKSLSYDPNCLCALDMKHTALYVLNRKREADEIKKKYSAILYRIFVKRLKIGPKPVWKPREGDIRMSKLVNM